VIPLTSTFESSARTYAVGDVHGRLDLLNRAVVAIADRGRGAPFRVIFLGDYVDRGPESRGVIELLMRLQGRWPVICLKGNHEELMIQAVTEPDSGCLERWLEFGGRDTLRSYDLRGEDDLATALPQAHLRWMAELPTIADDKHRIYVHAGLIPGTPARLQNDAVRLWIRERFLLGGAGDFEAHIVHGHTPVWERKPDPAEPELLPHRTNVDTGAFATGILSVAVFEDEVPGGPVEIWKVRSDLTEQVVLDRTAATAAAKLKKANHPTSLNPRSSKRARSVGGIGHFLRPSDPRPGKRGRSHEQF
jgi:serine/threonine protein phosphatase 1